MTEYYIPTGPGEAEFTEKRSRFLGHVRRVESEEEAKVLRLEYTDDGIEAEAVVTPETFGKVKEFIPGYREPKEDWED